MSINQMMESFSDRLLRKREALLRSIQKADKRQDDDHEMNKQIPLERDSGHNNLTTAVHRSVKNLIKLGFNFSQIIEGSGVSEAFLRQAYRELSLDVPNAKPETPQAHLNPTGYLTPKFTLRKQESPDASNQGTEKQTSRTIEAELRLFMLKTRLEINRLRSLAKQPELAKQLKRDHVQSAIRKLKDAIFSNLEDFFNELELPAPAGSSTKPLKRAQDDLTSERSQKKARTHSQEPTTTENHLSTVCDLMHS
ncbi:hypothetical protein HG537_0A00930 [Torulaspora globosa]|uniref:Uncharacterized protein n=1 Tax=Torulaspora globosa TaxID=48254 RepID=A0A7H9HK61_9SACH|nr:hypothetical protein HG537_0A00930 [Torulaspora sp. CBS 2947]